MKKYWCILVFFTISLIHFQTLFSQSLFNPDGLTLIEITFENSNWDQQLDAFYAADLNERLLATIEINGESFDSVGIRYRGGGTYNADQGKNPFNIKLDYIKNHDYAGTETLILNNGAKDPSFVREVLSHDIANQYMPSPRANYAKVFVNGSYHGLYVNVENVDKNFMSLSFNSNRENTFFDCSPDGTIDPPIVGCAEGIGSSLEYLGASVECYKDYYDKKSDPIGGWNELVNLSNAMEASAGDIENSINIDRAIWMLAMQNLIVNLESYIGAAPENYYLFRDENDRFNTLPNDFNETFGGDALLDQGQQELTLTELQNLDPLLRSNDNTHILMKLILQDSRYKRQYLAHFRTMLEEIINSGWYATRAQELVNMISIEVTNDPNKIYSESQFIANLNNTTTIDYNGTMIDIPGVAELMNQRLTYLLAHPEFTKTPPGINNIGHFPLDVIPNSNNTITAEVTDADFIYLGYRNNLTEVFQRVEMFDDGNHSDGVAGDGVYGGDIFVGLEGIQYYIYAENSNTDVGTFSPKRAEEEYYNLTTYGDVVINELMASNSTIVADQDGEYEDWVELYNNTSTSMNLNGYYLTDDANDLMKYQFPNVTIDGDGYIIVWLDSDPSQQGLHADFKLSANGEELLLVNANLQVVDKVVFGAQTTDVSYARFPNGIGEFVAKVPTFNSSNGLGSANVNLAKELGVKIYPNPTQDYLTIEIKEDEDLEVDIFNALGQKIRSFQLSEKIQLDIADFRNGFYWLSTKGRVLGRVVVQK
ncbi:CotH kinase family protein [Saprospiraceae bacterium]|nr:CotH kinase family protein [Saprospiraceae bacterium]